MEKREDTRPPLQVAVGTPLLMEIPGLQMRVKCELVGIASTEFLMLRLNHSDLAGTFRSDAVKDCPVILRFIYNGTVYGFETMVVNAVSSPARVLFVDYPEEIEQHNTRVTPRYDCLLPARTCIGNDGVESIVVDISLHGCRCSLKTVDAESAEGLDGMLNLDAEVGMKIKLPGVAEELTLTGVVRNISKDSEKTNFGVKFKEMDPEVKSRFEGFLSMIESL